MKYPAIVSKSHLFKLSIPIFFSNLAIPMVGVIDTWLMGHQGNASYLAAISISTSVISIPENVKLDTLVIILSFLFHFFSLYTFFYIICKILSYFNIHSLNGFFSID